MRRTETSFKVVGLPGGTERIGGEDFDHRMYQHLGAAVAREDASVWEAMTTSDERQWRRAAADLLTQAREAKEQLSRNPRASVYIGALERDITVTRDEFDTLISADVDRTVEEMGRTIESAGLTDADLVKVYLVGGSSRLTLVQERMGARFGARISTWDDPKGVVVLGAAKFSATLTADALAAPVAPGTTPPPTPTGPVVVSAPPPRPGVGPEGYAPPGAAPPPAPTYPPPGEQPYAAPGAAPAAPAAYTPAPGPSAPSQWAAPAQPAWAPGTPAPVGYGTPAGVKPAGGDKLVIAWICAVLGLFCCVPAPAVGLYFANEAKKAGHPQAQAALVVNAISLGLSLIGGFLIFLSSLSTSTTA